MVNNILQKSSLLFLIGAFMLVSCSDDNKNESLGELKEEEKARIAAEKQAAKEAKWAEEDKKFR